MDVILDNLREFINGYITQLVDFFNGLDVFIQATALILATILMLFGVFGFLKFAFSFVKVAIIIVIIIGGAYFALKMFNYI